MYSFSKIENHKDPNYETCWLIFSILYFLANFLTYWLSPKKYQVTYQRSIVGSRI